MMKKKMEIKEIVIPAFMTAVMAVLSPISIPIGPVPFSLGTFSVCLSATVLGKNLSTLASLFLVRYASLLYSRNGMASKTYVPVLL